MLRFTRRDVARVEKKTPIVDGAAAKAWLAGLSNPPSTKDLVEIAAVVNALGAAGVDEVTAMPPERRFAIAERIRSVVLQVLAGRARDDRSAVLPVDDEFALHFWATIQAANALRDVYAWLVPRLPRGYSDPLAPVDAAAPLPAVGSFVSGIGALQRALDVNAQSMSCIQRARWPVPLPLWERHCVLGQLVRDLDCHDVEVGDPLRIGATMTCRSAFVLPVLIALADPSARSPTEFDVMRTAAQRWSAKVGFRLERSTGTIATPARPVPNPGPSVALGDFLLRFDTQSAMQSIDRRLEALSAGKTPRDIGFGDRLRPQAARDLLLVLQQRWGAVSPADIDSPERAWRNADADVSMRAVVGMPSQVPVVREGAGRGGQNTYAYHLTRPDGITRSRAVIEHERVEQLLSDAETWTLVAEAADALRCIRRHPRPRIGLQRLIGLRLGQDDRGGPFLIGWVEGLQGMPMAPDAESTESRSNVAHTVRVRLAPGIPQMVHASIDDVALDCAFLLAPAADAVANAQVATGRGPVDPVVAMNLLSNQDRGGWEPVRAAPRDYGLVLPVATFRPHRVVKAVRQGTLAMLRLDELMVRGSDFDLVRFTPV